MPSPFGTGLTEGFIKGWSEQSEKQDQIKRQQKQQEIENRLAIIRSGDISEGAQKQAAQELQDLIAGKKPGGKSQGGLSPVMDNLLKLIGKSHQKQGGPGEVNPANGQAAPGTAGSTPGAGFPQGAQPGGQPPPLPSQGPNGRPTEAHPPQPGDVKEPDTAHRLNPGPAQPQQSPAVDNPKKRIAAQIDNLTRRLESPDITPNQRKSLTTQIEKLQTQQEQLDKESMAETARAGLAKDLAATKAENATAMAELKAAQAKEMERVKQEDKQALAETNLRHQKEVKELQEKLAEKLKKTAPARNAGTGGGVDARARQRRVDRINDEHARASRAATDKYNAAKAKADQLSGTAKGIALRDAREALDRDTQLAEQAYKDAVRGLNNGGGGGTGGVGGGTVQMKSPDGQVSPVPADQVEHYKSRGAVVVQ